MKTIVLVMFLAALAAAGFWYVTENDRADRERAYIRSLELKKESEARAREYEERKKAEDERMRKERAEALARDDAMRMFLRYIDREEERLRVEVETAEINLEKIDIDQEALEGELRAIESANSVRVASAEKRGDVHRDKVERVRAILSSVVFNRLARVYCGSDLSGLRSDFESEMQKIKDVDDRYQKRIRSNIAKYDETVKGADEKVSRRLKAARDKYNSYQKNADPKRIDNIKKQIADNDREIDKITKNKSRSPWQSRRKKDLEERNVLLQNQLSQLEDISGLAGANVLHMDATEAETEARRVFDNAGKTLTLENDMALLERDHEQDIYNRAREYEDKSLLRIRNAIMAARNFRGEALAMAKRHLGYLKQKAVNIDFLSAEELESLRKEIANGIAKSINEVEEGK